MKMNSKHTMNGLQALTTMIVWWIWMKSHRSMENLDVTTYCAINDFKKTPNEERKVKKCERVFVFSMWSVMVWNGVNVWMNEWLYECLCGSYCSWFISLSSSSSKLTKCTRYSFSKTKKPKLLKLITPVTRLEFPNSGSSSTIWKHSNGQFYLAEVCLGVLHSLHQLALAFEH